YFAIAVSSSSLGRTPASEDLVALTMTMNRIVLSRCVGLWNCLFTSWSFGNAGNRAVVKRKPAVRLRSAATGCQITNPSIPPQARGELYEYSGAIWTQYLENSVHSCAQGSTSISVTQAQAERQSLFCGRMSAIESPDPQSWLIPWRLPL